MWIQNRLYRVIVSPSFYPAWSNRVARVLFVAVRQVNVWSWIKLSKCGLSHHNKEKFHTLLLYCIILIFADTWGNLIFILIYVVSKGIVKEVALNKLRFENISVVSSVILRALLHFPLLSFPFHRVKRGWMETSVWPRLFSQTSSNQAFLMRNGKCHGSWPPLSLFPQGYWERHSSLH